MLGEKVSYIGADWYNHGLATQTMNSLVLPYGYSVDVYSGKNLEGTRETLKTEFYQDQSFLLECLSASFYSFSTLSDIGSLRV